MSTLYGLLTAILGLIYAAVVLLLGQAFGGVADNPPSSGWPALPWLWRPIPPARRRLQAVVDRRFNQPKYDAARTVAAFIAQAFGGLGAKDDRDADVAEPFGEVDGLLGAALDGRELIQDQHHVIACPGLAPGGEVAEVFDDSGCFLLKGSGYQRSLPVVNGSSDDRTDWCDVRNLQVPGADLWRMLRLF